MKKYYQLLLALGVAAASLTSCSRANYAFNPATPAYLGTQPIHPVAKTAPTPTASENVATTPPSAVPVAPATPPAPTAAAQPKAVATAPTPAATVTTEALPAETAAPLANKVVKPSLVQRLVLKKLAKQVAKIQQMKQAAANTQHTASKLGRSALIALAGLVLALLGILIAGGSISGGSGAGVVIGVIFYYIGVVAFIVGLVLVVIHLINGD